VAGSEFIIECDYLIGAIGQNVETSFIKHDAEVQLEKWGTVKVSSKTMETSRRVYLPGGCSYGSFYSYYLNCPGKEAALAIISYLEKVKPSGQWKVLQLQA